MMGLIPATQATRPAVNARECNLMTEAGRLRELLRDTNALCVRQVSIIGERSADLRRAGTVQGITDAIRKLDPTKTTPTELQGILGALASHADAMAPGMDTETVCSLIDRAADACDGLIERDDSDDAADEHQDTLRTERKDGVR